MEAKFDILTELKTISPLLAGLDKINVFSVPAGYFNSISETVLACLREDSELPGVRTDATVPPAYFENLAGSIMNHIKAQQISAKDEIKALSPLLFSIQAKSVFKVPGGYFENLLQTIPAAISKIEVKEELMDLSPILSEIQNKKVFEAPDKYFSELPGIILQKAKAPAGKVVSMGRRFIQVAAAAILIGAIAFGIIKYTDKQSTSNTNNNSAFANLNGAIEKGRKMDDQQFKAALESLNEVDISNYLEINGDITDISTLGNNLDGSTLPSEEDYLLDATTLENYLNRIETTTLNN